MFGVAHPVENRFQSSLLLRALSLLGMVFLLTSVGLAQSSHGKASVPKPIHDPSGDIQTFSQTGFIDTNNAFFQSLGTNGRTCNSCHQEGDAGAYPRATFRKDFCPAPVPIQSFVPSTALPAQLMMSPTCKRGSRPTACCFQKASSESHCRYRKDQRWTSS
jgi:hypothetical protein